MTNAIHNTCDAALRSWVASANEARCDFPIQNLPFGVFRDREVGCVCIGVAIGDSVLDVHGAADEGMFAGLPVETLKACRQEELNSLMALGIERHRELRAKLSALLREDAAAEIQNKVGRCLFPLSEVTMLMPAVVGDYTDFYASIDHATRAGALFRPERPLLPNYKHIPIGYHGRASSLILSGVPVTRPCGQILEESSQLPHFAATGMLDYEAEIGFFIGVGNAAGEPVPIDRAGEHIFGACLVNDWSARDMQAWEYQPLGPFLAKSFATSLSPWVVTTEALAPFRVAARSRSNGDPELLGYLRDDADQEQGGLDIQLEVRLRTAAMRQAREPAVVIAASSTRDLYWTPGQMLAHHTSNGCHLRPGDLFATGTVSGSDDSAMGCLLELTGRGARPVRLPNGEERGFLADGDEVTLSGYCESKSHVRIGFGECRAVVLPARI